MKFVVKLWPSSKMHSSIGRGREAWILQSKSGRDARAPGVHIGTVLCIVALAQAVPPSWSSETKPSLEPGTVARTEATSGAQPAAGSAGSLPASTLPNPATPNQVPNSKTHSTNDDAVQIEKSDFGIVTDRSGPTKYWKLHPVVVIPNLPGIQYAWKLRLNPRSPVFVREEFTLPEAPSSWKIKQEDTSSQLLQGGELCVLENFQATDEGWIGHSWTASRGDPPGTYQIKIFLNGKLAHTFQFNVGDAIETDPHARDI